MRVALAVLGGTAHLIRLAGRTPGQIRRVPAHDVVALLEAAGPAPGRTLLLADPAERTRLAPALERAGWTLVGSGDSPTAPVEAARHADQASPELVPAPLALARKGRSRRITARMLAASVLTLAAAAVVHMLGTVRQYRAVQQERAEQVHDGGGRECEHRGG